MTGLRLYVCPQRGSGFVLLESEDFLAIAPGAQWRITRAGMSMANLGAAGWQIPPFAHTLPKVGPKQFLLGPEIVSHMVQAANYRVTILQSGQDEIDLVLTWRGIPGYRPGEDSTVSHAPAPPALPKLPEFTPPTQVVLPSAVMQPAAPIAPQPLNRKRVRCPNEACGKEILSTFARCPWCKMDLTARG